MTSDKPIVGAHADRSDVESAGRCFGHRGLGFGQAHRSTHAQVDRRALRTIADLPLRPGLPLRLGLRRRVGHGLLHGGAEKAVGLDVDFLLDGGAGEDWVRLERLRHAERELAEARSCEKARGCEHRKTAIHRVALWPAELDARSRTCLALGHWRAPRAVGTGWRPPWHPCCSPLLVEVRSNGERRMCSLRRANHGMVHGRKARQQDLLLRELRERASELATVLGGDRDRLGQVYAASASGAISSSDRPRVSSPRAATAAAVIRSIAMNTANVPLTVIAGTRTGVRYGPMIPPTRPTAAAMPEPVARTDVG